MPSPLIRASASHSSRHRSLPILGSLAFLLHASAAGATSPPLAPAPIRDRLVLRTGDRSVVVHWEIPATAGTQYELHRRDGRNHPARCLERRLVPHFADLTVTNGGRYRYFVRRINPAGAHLDSPEKTARPQPFASNHQFLELLQATAFDYFWYEANPANGLVRDRSTTNSFCSIAATGFGLSAISIGIDHGWITRDQGRVRVLAALRTLWNGPQGTNSSGCIGYRGWFYHFLDLDRATRFDRVELSSIDTALLLAGALDARQFFRRAHPAEREIRRLVDALVRRVDWAWMANGQATLTMGWHPETGFLQARWQGYNEAMILYLLALGAPDDPLPPTTWQEWTRTCSWQTHEGLSFVNFPPLFGHQYSHCWIDFRNRADAYLRPHGISYFENSRRATLAQRAYAHRNPNGWPGYSLTQWGFTACDGPGQGRFHAYAARGTPPPEYDDGTIAPTATGGSLPFAPSECLDVLRHLYDVYRVQLWTPYGFRDAFNLAADWWDPDVLGIDQGPILLMAENHRTSRLWKRIQRDPVMRTGLQRAGFEPLPLKR